MSKNSEQGFTIIEMLVSVAIGMLVIAISIGMFVVQRKTFSLQEELSEMNQNAIAALNMISRDVRLAGYMVGGTFTTTGTASISFSIGGTATTYNHDGSSDIELNSQPIADKIESLSFSYGNDGSGNTDTVTITIVAISSNSDASYSGDGFRRATVTSTVKLRN